MDLHDAPPSRIPWPPILIVAALLVAKGVDQLLGLAAGEGWRIFGGALVVMCLSLDVWCFATLSRHRTTVMPHRAASTLVTNGPYAYSRNPIYVSHVAVTGGLGLLLGSLSILALTPLVAYGLQKLAVEPEERHLSRKFGATFDDYAARTPRWLGWSAP